MNLLNDIRFALLPETILMLLVLLTTVLSFTLNKKRQGLIYYVSIIGCGLSLLSFLELPLKVHSAIFDSFISDGFTILFRIFIIIGTIITLQLTKKYVSTFGKSTGEFYTLLLASALGAMLLSGANDLIMVFIAMETLGLSCYALTGYTKKDKLSNEAALKYLVIGAASTAVLLYGFSFLYGITGETNITSISKFLEHYKTNLIFIISFLFILGGFAYKIAAVPFYTWAADVYQGAPVPVAAFLSVVSKIAGFAIIIRILNLVYLGIPVWTLSIGTIAVLTMTVGNLLAVSQPNLKRLMAYSSIAQAGYVLVGLVLGTAAGISAMIFYLIVYLFTNFGAWAAIEIFINKTGKDNIEDMKGLAYKQPLLVAGLTVCLLSLAGIPITAGFFSKFYLFQVVFMAGHKYLWLLIITLINTVISVFYYLRVIKSAFMKATHVDILKADVIKPSLALNTTLSIILIIVLSLGLFSASFITLSQKCGEPQKLDR